MVKRLRHRPLAGVRGAIPSGGFAGGDTKVVDKTSATPITSSNLVIVFRNFEKKLYIFFF